MRSNKCSQELTWRPGLPEAHPDEHCQRSCQPGGSADGLCERDAHPEGEETQERASNHPEDGQGSLKHVSILQIP